MVKSGPDRAPCVTGREETGWGLAPGEVVLSVAEGTELRLLPGGGIRLVGDVAVEGSLTVNGEEV